MPGNSVSTTIHSSGDGTLSYQWYRNGCSTATPVPGQTSATLTLNNVQQSDAGTYYALVGGAGGGSGVNIWSEPFTLTVSAPVLTVTNPAAVCVPATVDLTMVVLANISGSTFAFFTDAAATQPLTNPAAVAVSGTYYVRATSPAGCVSAMQSVDVTINPRPAVTITANGPTTFCPGASVVLTASEGASYMWSTETITRSVTVTQSGSYTVTVTTDAGCSATSDATTVTVTDTEKPVITACAPAQSAFTDANCSAKVPDFTVNVTATDNCTAANDLKITQLPAAGTSVSTGSTSVTITVTDASGNYVTCNTTFTVTDNTNPVISACAPAQSASAGANCSAAVPDFTANVTATDNCTATNNLKITQSPAAGTSVSTGSTSVTITVTEASGNYVTCNTTFTVIDNTKSVITCPANQAFCYDSSGNYTIPTLSATDNCGVRSITYVISGATSRNGSGNNASGTFKPGTSTIIWTVTDGSGNQNTCQTTVIVNPKIVVNIPDAKALSSGVKANTVYKGYARAASITLTAQASGGTSPYTYKWSNGATTKSVKVSPASTTTYTVTVTDASGCSVTGSKKITVVDVRCGRKLDKVEICHKGKNTLCINQCDVAEHLKHGDDLGDCKGCNIAAKAGKGFTEDEAAREPRVTAYSNPGNGQFSIQLSNYQPARAEVLVLNVNGIVVEKRNIQLAAVK